MYEDFIDRWEEEHTQLKAQEPEMAQTVFSALSSYHTQEEREAGYALEEQIRGETEAQRELFSRVDQTDGSAMMKQASSTMVDMALAGEAQEYSSFTTSNIEDKATNYQITKRLAHDVAHLDSTEQAVVNQAHLMEARMAEPEIMQPAEALAYARENGVEIKVDKPISKGEIKYIVQMEQYRNELNEELAKYQESGDYSALQRLMITGSMLSGAIGFWETAAMAGTSWLGGAGVAAGLAKVGSALGKANKVMKGVSLAQKMMLAEKVARTSTNSTAKILQAAKTAKAVEQSLKKSNFATKVAYDAYRFGNQAAGTRASLASTMVPFAIDGFLTTAPQAVIKSYADQAMGTDHYTTKDALFEIGMGTTVAGALPVTGTLIKGAASQGGKVIGHAQDAIIASKNKRISDAIAKGYDAVIEQAEKDGVVLNDQMKDIIKIATAENKMSPQTYQNLIALKGQNLTDEEMTTLLTLYTNALKNGTSLTILDALPFKYKYYSNVPGMYDAMQEMARAEMTADDFFSLLSERSITLAKNKVDGTTLVQRLKSGSLGVGVKIGAEGGAMGRHFAHGLDEADAQKFLYNCYKYLNCDSDEALESGIQAGLEAEEYITRLKTIKQQMDMIIRTNDMINNANTQARNAGKHPAYKYSEQNIYTSTNGNFVSLEEAVFELAELMLPDSARAERNSLKQQLASANDLFEATGRGTLSDEERAELTAKLAEQDKQIFDLVDVLGVTEKSRYDDFTYFNLRKIEGGTEERTALLKQLANDMDKMVRENEELLNSDRIFMQTTESPEEILKKIQGKEDIPELSYSYDRATATALDMQNILASEESSMARLATAKAEVASYADKPVAESLSQIFNIITKQAESGARIAKGYLLDIQGTIMAADKVLTGNFGTFRNAFIEKLQANKFLQSMADKNGKLTPSSLARVLHDEGENFRGVLKSTLVEQVTGEFPVGTFGTKFEEAIDDAVDSFIDTLRKDPDGGLKQFIQKLDIDISGTGDEIATAVQQVEKQKQAFDVLLEPLVRNIGKNVADLQADLLHTQARSLDLWERCLANPDRMSEIILGDVTMTYMPTKGASASIENLAGYKTEYQNFLKALDLSDDAERGVEPLRGWAFRPENMPEIQDAIIDRWAFVNDLMSPEEKLKYKPNSRAGRVAMAYLDNLANMRANLYNVGSGKQELVSFFDPSKLRSAGSYLQRKVWGTPIHQGVEAIAQSTRIKGVAGDMAKFLPRNQSKGEMRRANLAMHLFEQLDLDKHFNKYGASKLSLNEVRDAILEGAIPGQGSPLDRLVLKHGERDVQKAIKRISDGFFGHDLDIGLINRLENGSSSISAEMAGHKSKYLEDLKAPLYYKSLVAQKEDLASFGYDNMKSWYESDMGKAKKAYAVLAKAGSEPFQFYQSMKEIARTYANKVVPSKHGIENAKILQESVKSDRFEGALNYAVNTVCGTYSIPASQGIKIAQLVVRVLSTPMLMKAGLKSVTDYNYQFQDLVTMGLASGTDFGTRARIASRFAKSLTTDKKLSSLIYLKQTMSADTLYEKMLNAPMMGVRSGEGSRAAGFKGVGQLNEYASRYEKAERMVRGYSDFLLNKMAWIGPLTELNRSNAAIQIMQSIGDFASEGNTWKQIASANPRLTQTLERYGITEFEWDNILSKEAVMNLDDYIKKYHGSNEKTFGDFKMFFPDLVSELSDDQIAGYLKAQAKPVTPQSIQAYRQVLTDKASMLINVGADEMTSIPTARVQGALSVGLNPNTWAGFGVNTLLQFQTFGAAVNYYHWGRRLATHMVQGDETFNKFLASIAWQSAAPDMVGFVSELAVAQFFVNEAISELSGNNRRLVNDRGDFQGDALAEKLGKAFADQLGFFGPVLDALVTGITTPQGKGGGIALSVLPTASTTTRKIQRITDAATKDATKGSRASAIGAAAFQDIAEMTGVPNQPMLQALWSLVIGDYLTELQKGTNYDRYMRQRRRRGYGPSWLQYGWDELMN